MWFSRKTRRSRIDSLRASGQEPSALRRLWLSGGGGALLVAAVFFAAVLAMDLTPVDPMPYRRGQYVPHDLHPRVVFKIQDPELVRAEEKSIKGSNPATFVLNSPLADKIAQAVLSLPEAVKAASQPADVPDKTREAFGLGDAASLAKWQPYADEARKKELVAQVDKLKAALATTYVVRTAEADAQWARTARKFKAIRDGQAQEVNLADMISQGRQDRIAEMLPRLAGVFDAPLRPSVIQYLQSVLASPEAQPLYAHDPAVSEQEKNQAIAQLKAEPPEAVFVKYGPSDVLVPGMVGTDEVKGLDEARYLPLLRKEHEDYLQKERQFRPWEFWGRIAGRAGLLGLITAVLCIYLVHYRPEVVRDRWQSLALAVSLLTLLAANKLLAGLLGWPLQTSMLAVLMAAIVLVIAFDRRFAWVMGTIFAIYVTLQDRADLGMYLVFLIAITAATVQLGDIRSRSKLIVASLTTAGVAFLAGGAAGFAASLPWPFVARDGAWLAGAALLAGILAQALLPLIERVYGVATSMTLLEWGDSSRPALKRLAMEAPGTFNHSLQLGALCEAAAEAVGARGLLARVGAYYHDIGKINKPDYFAENQAGSPSKHAKLSPAMSLLIIIGHVKDGLEMAREFGLPRVLHEFIAAHHGTTLVQYFYQAAAEQRRTDTDRAPDEVEFRYPGPKPRTKEAAILMLADASESSVRSMTERTPGKIENQVCAMVERRLTDGQLDDCELTLREVHQIELSLIKSLTSMYHLRIAYPTPAGQKPSAGELQAQAASRKEETTSDSGT